MEEAVLFAGGVSELAGVVVCAGGVSEETAGVLAAVLAVVFAGAVVAAAAGVLAAGEGIDGDGAGDGESCVCNRETRLSPTGATGVVATRAISFTT